MRKNAINEEKFNKIEKEVIFLKAIKGMIDEMVNYGTIEIRGKNPECQIYFHESIHQRYFNILLVDFLSCTDNKIIGETISYIKALNNITEKPSFNMNNSVENLTKAVNAIKIWLEYEFKMKIWLSEIGLDADLCIKRIEFIKICGNISKHNFSRLSGVVSEIKSIFSRNNIILTDEKILISLENFYEWFHDDVFNYHGSSIVEFLNNISWGIYEYLKPEYYNSLIITDDPIKGSYIYSIPTDIKNGFAKTCYWNLMNEIQLEPFVPKFIVTSNLKKRY